MHGLGRIPSPPDGNDWQLKRFLSAPEVTERFWDIGPILDQGSTPHCVGFSSAGWGNCLPVDDDWQDKDGHAIYRECKVLDGELDGENGSYVRTAAKVLQNRERIDNYAFGSVSDAHRFLLTQGPVVFGIDWYSGMGDPDENGVIRPTGYVAGGHAILAYGADENYCHLQNSWGKSWGNDGCCKISWADLETCFGQWGEAMAAVELPLDAPPQSDSLWARIIRFVKYLWSLL